MWWEEKLKGTPITKLSAIKMRNFEIAESFQWGEGVKEETQFQAASISKPVFSVALLHLFEEKGFSLDEDIREYCKKFNIVKADGSPARVTARQLLTHTAGLNVHGFLGYTDPMQLPTTLQILNGESPCNSEKVIQVDEPGQHWKYSGGGYMVLQQAAEEITGMEFSAFMERYVLQPLGMKNSTFVQSPEGHIEGYASEDPASPYGFYFMPEHAAAGLWTTPQDLMRFGSHLQKIRRGEKGILSQKLTDQILTPQLEEVFKGEGGRDCKMGLGFFLKTIQGHEYFGHSGGNVGFVSVMNFSKEAGDGVCVMVNADAPEALRCMLSIQSQLLEEEK